jgi:PhoPQ-activated pathogenicity-related protein
MRGLVAALLLPALAAAAPAGGADALLDYVARPDPALAWTSHLAGRQGRSAFRELVLTSQVWRGITWRHQLFVVCPDNARAGRPAVLFMAGGNWRDRYLAPPGRLAPPAGTARYVRLARRLQAPLAVLLQVPFQPLAGGLTEDALVAWSFGEFFATGDPVAPLLLPMVKAGSAALTAVTAIARHDCGVAPERFVVTGASKRGWATWLLAAADARVAGIVPTAFDAVRMDRQVQHQLALWGSLSPLLKDYRPLVERLGTPAGDALLALVDPWRYRPRLDLPKLIVRGSNDAYWPPDSAGLYLAGMAPASLLYLPNDGHVPADLARLTAGVVALADAVAAGSGLPAAALSATVVDGQVELQLTVNGPARGARFWVARSDHGAFRHEPYAVARARRQGDGSFAARLSLQDGYIAVFGEVDLQGPSGRYRLSSPLSIVGPDGVQPLSPAPAASAGAG